jgi:DNA-binding cell septation regulator SpoVG
MSNLDPAIARNQSFFVLQVRPSPKPGAVKAYADIQYHNLIIKGLSVVEHNGGHFVGLPSTAGKNGKRFPIVEFSDPDRSEIFKAVIEATATRGLL